MDGRCRRFYTIGFMRFYCLPLLIFVFFLLMLLEWLSANTPFIRRFSINDNNTQSTTKRLCITSIIIVYSRFSERCFYRNKPFFCKKKVEMKE